MLLKSFGLIRRNSLLKLSHGNIIHSVCKPAFSTVIEHVKDSHSNSSRPTGNDNYANIKAELVKTFKTLLDMRKTNRTSTRHNEMYQRQLALEEEQFDLAVQEYVDMQSELMAMGRGTSLKSVQKSMVCWYEPLCTMIENELASYTSDQKKIESEHYGAYLAVLPIEKLAVITLNTTVNLIMSSGNYGMKVVNLVSEIGNCIESEYGILKAKNEVRDLKKSGVQPDHWQAETLKATNSPSLNTKAAKALTKKLRQISKLEEWTEAVKVKIGTTLLNLLINSAKREGTGEPVFQHSLLYIHKVKRNVGIVKLHPEEFQALALKDLKFITPRLLPMLVPPKDWNNKLYRGAYLTLKAPLMKAVSKMQTEAVRRAEMDDVLEGLNYLGQTGWRINKVVLSAIEQIWEHNLQLGDVPSSQDLPLPDKNLCYRTPRQIHEARYKWKIGRGEEVPALDTVEDPDTPIFDERMYEDLCNQIKKKNSELHSLRCDLTIKLDIARMFRNEVMYFPHNLDFRGRAYPVPPNLSHLGSDLCRGMMIFNEARPLGEEGFAWLKVHLCNLYGNNKISLADRIKWTEQHMEDVLDSATQPLEGKRWWSTFECPFQALATCAEIKAAIDSGNPATFYSHLPIHQDGSCNGLQHYAGLGRDEKGAKAVNLIPSSKPQDVYSEVLALVLKKIDEDCKIPESSDDSHLGRNARIVLGKINRKVIKQTVMTSVYGVTQIGARMQVQARLMEKFHDENPGIIMTKDIERDLYYAAGYVANLTLRSLEEMFESAKDIMNWLADCSAVCSETGQSMSWVTPLGLPVSQPYRKPTSQTVKTPLQSVSLSVHDDGLPVATKKQKSAFPPNFVHSLDATHMLMTCLKMKNEGKVFASVHDSYWTHACDVTLMNELLRDCFVHLYEYPVLDDLKDSLDMRFPDKEFPEIPRRGSLDIKVVRDSQYFFH